MEDKGAYEKLDAWNGSSTNRLSEVKSMAKSGLVFKISQRLSDEALNEQIQNKFKKNFTTKYHSSKKYKHQKIRPISSEPVNGVEKEIKNT